MPAPELKRMAQIYGTQAAWSVSSLVPLQGEMCVEYVNDNDIRFKSGDGSRRFVDLPYTNVTFAGSVSSFNGRGPTGGNIDPAGDDYDADMIDETENRIWFTPDGLAALAALDPELQLPEGGTALQVLARLDNNPRTYVWVDPSGGSAGAVRTTDLLDFSNVAPTEGQVAVFRGAAGNKYTPENQSTTASARIKKNSVNIAGKIGGVNIPFTSGFEDKLTMADIANGSIHLQFDNSISHATDEVIVASFITDNYNSADDFRLYFESAVAVTATPAVLVNVATSNRTTGISNTVLAAGANTLTLSIAAGTDLALRLVYSVNAADATQPTYTSGFEMTVAGGAAVLTPWTSTTGNVINGNALRQCSFDLALGNLASAVTYTFKPIWTDAAGTPQLSANVNNYALTCYVVSGADQFKPFEGRHTDQYAVGTSVVDRVFTNGPQRLIVHSLFKRSNTGNTAITYTPTVGYTTFSEGNFGGTNNSASMRVINVWSVLAAEGSDTLTFTIQSSDSSPGSFAVRPSVMSGMTIHVDNNKAANIAGDSVLGTIFYDKNLRDVRVNY